MESIDKPVPAAEDVPGPQPSDGPDYHVDHVFWGLRQGGEFGKASATGDPRLVGRVVEPDPVPLVAGGEPLPVTLDAEVEVVARIVLHNGVAHVSQYEASHSVAVGGQMRHNDGRDDA